MKQAEFVNFNKKIYPKKAIQLSVGSFKHLAKFEIIGKGGCFTVKINKFNAESASIIKDEFSNFVLAMIKEI